ncbi:MAG TPA: hypothetical protein VN516_08825, partial [Candidatus Baltobacteraceae bacterium]|nr:hypothetical protein [Candidatus Baltobacteraceae bacterium]
KNRKEMAGDLILATNANGNFFIQFSKTPFTLATAEVQDNQWEIKFGADKYALRGGGTPPVDILWFQLPPALLGNDLTDDWKLERSSGNLWRLKNSQTGETLAGQFFP